MLISVAHAQEVTADITTDIAEMADTPSAASAFAWNMGLILVMVIMFYLLLIKPQQKRFQAHKAMMDGLKKGDRVSTAGGLIGTIDKLVNDTEVVVDLGDGTKVTALRHTLSDILDETKSDKKSDKKDEKKK